MFFSFWHTFMLKIWHRRSVKGSRYCTNSYGANSVRLHNCSRTVRSRLCTSSDSGFSNNWNKD